MRLTCLKTPARAGLTSALRAAAVMAAAAFAMTSTAGCSLLSSNLERAAKGAGKVVHLYCENITIPEIREQIRTAVNQHAAPHSVAVNCVDGGPALETTGVKVLE